MSASELTDKEYNATEVFKPILGNKKNYHSLGGSDDQKICYSSQKSKLAKILLVACGLSTIIIVLTLIIVLIIVFIPKNDETSNTDPWKSSRLPSNVHPISYNINLTPNLTSLVVTGDTQIMITVDSPTDIILVHSLDINFTLTELHDADAQDIPDVTLTTELYSENQYLILRFSKSLSPADYILLFRFTYYLYSGGLSGFYNSTYRNSAGDNITIAATQFESTSARRAFPCFDEPAMKANFTISITHPSNMTALSNMPVDSTRNVGEGQVETSFTESVPMSTYLVAFVVSNFENNSVTTKNNVIISIWSRSDVFNQTSYALTIADKLLTYYEELFKIDFPLPKIDLVAIPDFSSGAMENWGLITYRETALLYEANVSSQADKQWVASVIAHELAHQWFGNLVTMEWWQDLWLNEGFASYVEYLGSNYSEPEWDILAQFLPNDLYYAFIADGYNESHPVIQEVATPNEIESLFDYITYQKGGSLIRMVIGFMGLDVFTHGLYLYLNEHKYGNANSGDLWEALNKVFPDTTGVKIADIMQTWTLQMGYPVLNITILSNNKITVTQERFFQVATDPSMVAKSQFDYIWKIPFTFMTDTSNNAENNKIYWLLSQSQEIEIPTSSSKWIKANVDQKGFYRVNYNPDNWLALMDELTTASGSVLLTENDRSNLMNDAVYLSLGGYLSSITVMNLTTYLANELEYVPWRSSLSALASIREKIAETQISTAFDTYIRSIMSNIVNILSVGLDQPASNHTNALFRSFILKQAVLYGETSVTTPIFNMFESFRVNNSKIDADLTDVVYTTGIISGDETQFDFLWARYLTSILPAEQDSILSALSYVKQPALITTLLGYSLTGVRSQDTTTVLRRLGNNAYARDYLWDFFKTNYETLFNKFGEGSFGFQRTITAVCSKFTTEDKLDDVYLFFRDNTTIFDDTTVRASIENIRGSITWLADNISLLEKWLAEKK